VFIVAFPVYLAFIASTHDAATVVSGNMPLSRAGRGARKLLPGHLRRGSRTARDRSDTC